MTAFSGADNTTWTVVRGQQGTAAATALAGAAVTPAYGAQIVSWGGGTGGRDQRRKHGGERAGHTESAAGERGRLAGARAHADEPDPREPVGRAAGISDGAARRLRQSDLPDDEGLFDYFLIDVQMTSCQVTSRVVQAYIAVQIFVERCLMNLETTRHGQVVLSTSTQDDTWNQWEWMSRYRIWEANREVFCIPENWLIESQRPSRTEIYQKLEQEVRQGQSTADYLETVVLNYIDRLDGLAHLLVTGTCEDPETGRPSTWWRARWPIRPSSTCALTRTARGPAGRRFRSTSRPTRRFRPFTGAGCAFSGWSQGVQRAAAGYARGAANPIHRHQEGGPVRRDRREFQHLPQRQLGAGASGEGQAVR